MDNQQPQQKQIKKSNGISGWILGILFFLGGLSMLATSIISGLLAIIAGSLLLPATRKIFEDKTKIHLSRKLLVGIIIFLLILIGIALPDTKDEKKSGNSETSANTNQKTITIPSLVEYDDDITADDEVQGIKKEDVAIPSDYTVISAGNTNLTNTIGSEVVVSETIDGDTVKLSDGNKVRILGIDTPETVDPRKAVQCFGKEASAKMKELVSGKKVILLVDSSQGDKDKYGRLLRYIYLDNVDIGAAMIQEGYAYAYLKYPTSKTEEYKVLEAQAREGKKGLWAENTCNGSTEIPTTIIQTDANTVMNTNTSTNLNVAPTFIDTNTSKYTCDCKKTCTQITACEEAYFQLNDCGCAIRDNDKDGVPCESICK